MIELYKGEPRGRVEIDHIEGRYGDPVLAVYFPPVPKLALRAHMRSARRMFRWLDSRRPITAAQLDRLYTSGVRR